ncbi:hypothetical protein J6590_085698 [Homalodisca vitripennis]|nr:hypothetical protein J6590_085698 [Homalodisca vitripennis]
MQGHSPPWQCLLLGRRGLLSKVPGHGWNPSYHHKSRRYTGTSSLCCGNAPNSHRCSLSSPEDTRSLSSARGEGGTFPLYRD